MAKFSLRRYDHQAIMSLTMSLISVLSLLGLAVILVQNMKWDEMIIYYGSSRKMAVMAGTAVTLLLSAIGFGFGFNSVGQRRNEKQKLSWLGFFIGAGVISLTLILFILFRFRGEAVL